MACCLLVTVGRAEAAGFELTTARVTIRYDHEFLLRDFQARLSASEKSFFMRRKKTGLTVSDEISAAVDGLLEQVQTILEMFPPDLRLTIVLLPSANGVREVYGRKYHREVDYIAFYAPRDKTIYLSVRDASLRVLGHEMAHAVVEHHFIVPPPTKVHELLAQYVEAQLID